MERIREQIQRDILDVHLSSKTYLHRDRYFNVRSIYSSNIHCETIKDKILESITNEGLHEDVTIVGFRKYIGPIISKISSEIRNSNYLVLEKENDIFFWLKKPTFKETTIIILPISTTFSSYFDVRKFIVNYLVNECLTPTRLHEKFYSIFTILDQNIKKERRITFKSINSGSNKINNIYNNLGWRSVNEKMIKFKSLHNAVAESIFYLYCNLYIPDECPLCFPEIHSTEEKPLYEIDETGGFFNMNWRFTKFDKGISDNQFLSSFKKHSHQSPIILTNPTKVNGKSYDFYINACNFYELNKSEILKFFNKKLDIFCKKYKKITIIFLIGKYSSDLIYDITVQRKSIDLKILSFNPAIDDPKVMIGSNIKFINDPQNVTIYFEDILTNSKYFELLNGELKSQRTDLECGFNAAFTLINRVNTLTKNEILSQLTSNDLEYKFISYFNLNILETHNVKNNNYSEMRTERLVEMYKLTALDVNKNIILNSLRKHKIKEYKTPTDLSRQKRDNRYFPFSSLRSIEDFNRFKLYEKIVEKSTSSVIKLFLLQKITSSFSEDYNYTSLSSANANFNINDFILKVVEKVRDSIFSFIYSDGTSVLKNVNEENKLLQDYIIKILCRPPFSENYVIRNKIFEYCINKLSKLQYDIENDNITSYKVFRNYKFYIKRSVDLNSNFIISEDFISSLKSQYDSRKINSIIAKHQKAKDDIIENYGQKKIKFRQYIASVNMIEYKLEQVSTYFIFLQSCYKQLLYNKHYRSIKLESLINSDELLPTIIKSNLNDIDEIDNLLHNKYFIFTGILKAENIYLLHDLKVLHEKYRINTNLATFKQIKKFYFETEKNNTTLINLKKFLGKTRYRGTSKDIIDNISINITSKMLASYTKLVSGKIQYDGSSFDSRLRSILDSLKDILNTGIDSEEVNYALFVKYKNALSNDVEEDDIYSISSSVDWSQGRNLVATKEGIIYNMMSGLVDDSSGNSLQSFLSIIHYGNHIYSFNPVLFSLASKTEVTTKDMFRQDSYGKSNRNGIKFFNRNGITLLFRINYNSNRNPDKNRIGQAILLFTLNTDSVENLFFEFMSNEKLRLILALKPELSNYLFKQFSNDAFLEVLDRHRFKSYQRHLKHGIADYLDYQTELFSNAVNRDHIESSVFLFDIITNAIRGQIRANSFVDEVATISRQEFINTITFLLKSPMIGHRPIDIANVEFDLSFDKIEIPIILYTILVPELIINLIKYSPRTISEKYKISYSNGYFTFSNEIDRTTESNYDREGEGLLLCQDVLNHIGGGQLIVTEENNLFIVKFGILNEKSINS